MARGCRRRGSSDLTIYEKADELGGTWRDNRYPGLTCDVPSRFYSYSFAPIPVGRELSRRARRSTPTSCALPRSRAARDIRFGSEIVSARWDGARWRLRHGGGSEESS